MRKSSALTQTLVFTFSVCGCSTGQDLQNTDADKKLNKRMQGDLLPENSPAEICDTTKKPPVVAIAWTPVNPEYVIAAFEASGAEVVFLPQAVYPGFTYDEDNKLSESHLAPSGMLCACDADRLKKDWKSAYISSDILYQADLIVFMGGNDISPSLYRVPEEEKNAHEPFRATHDVSDYILMQQCLEADLPVFGICRGMQMLAIVSGAPMIQELSAYYSEQGKDCCGFHRMQKVSNRDYVPHDIALTDPSSLLYAAVQADLIPASPSKHHQAVASVENTTLKVTASAVYDDLEIIEGIERTDRRFALGIQSHPEIAATRGNGETPSCFTDAQSTVSFLKNLIALAGEGR